MGWRAERTAAGLSVGLLGPAVIIGERGVLKPVGQQMLRVLVGLLGVADGRAVSGHALIDGLWGEEWSPGREKNLHSRIWALRRLLEEAEPGRGASRLARSGEGYLLELDPGCLDIAQFRTLSGQGREAARAGGTANAAALFRAALSLWRGAALCDAVPFCPPLAGEAAILEEDRASVIEDRLDCDLALGRHGELIAELTTLAGQHPLRERLTGQLMVALWRCGQRGEALAAYARTRQVLAEELGLDPGPALRELHARVLADDPALSGAAASASSATQSPVAAQSAEPTAFRSVTSTRGAMPTPLASFVGRETELAELAKLIGRYRLVTITGPGGAGKTRLAIQVATLLTDDHRDGTWFVDLAELGDPAGVPGVMAAALGIHLAPGEPVMPQLIDRTAGMRAVLVMDNCEHLVETVATTVETVLESGPGVRVLATSRQPLGLPGENVWETPPIAFPRDQHLRAITELAAYDAVRLFIERMPQLRDDLAGDLRTIAQITATLDGLPLAIELAASPAARLGLTGLLSMLSDRVGLSLLRSRTGHRRQQTLDATISWSYDLLTPQMRGGLRRLSVFTGGFTLDAAAAVIGEPDAAEIVDALTERSLIVVDRGEVNGSGPPAPHRYRMLEIIRQFCASRSATEDDPDGGMVLRDAHARYFADLAARAAGPLTGWHQGRWLTALEADHANLAAALEHLLDRPGGSEDALVMILHLTRYWHNRGRLAECARLAKQGIQMAGDAVSLAIRCDVLNLIAQADAYHDLGSGRAYSAAALEIARAINAPSAVATALRGLAWAGYVGGEEEESSRLALEAVAIARATGDSVLLAECLVTFSLGIETAARHAAYEEALEATNRSGDRVYAGWAHNNLADTALIEGDMEAARQHLAQAQEIFLEVGTPFPMSLVNIGWVNLVQNDPDAAHGTFAEALRLAELQTVRRDGSFAILGLACVAAARGDAERAARLFGFADTELAGCGASWLVPEKTYRERWITAVAGQLGPELQGLYHSVRGADRRDLLDYALSSSPVS
jgi:predicted ATPase/DNA-binding SARP family transcriptional activator